MIKDDYKLLTEFGVTVAENIKEYKGEIRYSVIKANMVEFAEMKNINDSILNSALFSVGTKFDMVAQELYYE